MFITVNYRRVGATGGVVTILLLRNIQNGDVAEPFSFAMCATSATEFLCLSWKEASIFPFIL